MADTEVVTAQLQIAGYEDIDFERIDAKVLVGRASMPKTTAIPSDFAAPDL
ncbi:hypothetical protein [Mesorhizobium silamurunense]|uniref:hypothetical protein n=1 Tax=Mesorhizobium silamurunense TaxID=499528 RepID=UPI0017877A36|nr:hypothetical protein [Mesorhizobium silamurunense]